MSKSKIAAQAFIAKVKSEGWDIERVGDTLVTITKTFKAGCNEGFCRADSEYYGLLSMVPASGGSMWGTDGGGMGAIGAKRDGFFRMNISGVGTRFSNALKKEL